MKLRILDDSIRLRLDREEVDALGEGTAVESTTHFPGSTTFRCCLTVADAFSAAFDHGRVVVCVPADEARVWARDDSAVSLRGRHAAGGHELALLVEKDFECLNPRDGESQGNRFPNPGATRSTAASI
jgi:hypothetical protein